MLFLDFISGLSYEPWSKWLKHIYSLNKDTGEYIYEAEVYGSDSSLFTDYDAWNESVLQGGLLNFWLKDVKPDSSQGLGYTALKTRFPKVFDKFDTILPQPMNIPMVDLNRSLFLPSYSMKYHQHWDTR